MERAPERSSAPVRRADHPPPREALIRTLGVGLIAIAAIVASLAVARQRLEEPGASDLEKGPRIVPASARLDLDQLREAGM
jgi:hypothetical protein